MTGLGPINVGATVGPTGICGGADVLGSLIGDLNGPFGDQAMTLLAQEMNEALGKDPQKTAQAMQQLKLMQMQQLMMLLSLLDPEVQEAIRAAMGVQAPRAGGGGDGGGGRSGSGGGMRVPSAGTNGRSRIPGATTNPGAGTNGRRGNLPPVDPATRGRTIGDTNVPRAGTYPPGSPQQVALFREAARVAGVPESWAESPGLQNILRRESNGQVGRPNYTYGSRARDPSQWASIHDELKNGNITARSSATGLGQLLLSNVDRYYPNGRAGIGDPVQEAAGMMRYIKDRYGDPDNAWRLYGTRHEGY